MDLNISEPFEASNASEVNSSKQGIKRKLTKKNINVSLNITEAQSSQTEYTPTPTRFIRNCEEVGLFQDLQNVNPFEEGFRKALTGDTNKEIKTQSTTHPKNDDTLHTPNILPLICNVYSLADKTSKTAVADNIIIDITDSICSNDPVFVPNNIQNNQTQNTATKSRKRIAKNYTSQMQKEVVSKYNLRDPEIIKRDKRRESNRKAQRKAYQRRVETALEEKALLETLRDDNEQLKKENFALSIEVKKLRRQLRAISSNIILGQHKVGVCEKSFNASLLDDGQFCSSAETCLPKTPKPRLILPKLPDTPKLQGITKNNKIILIKQSNILNGTIQYV